MKSLSTCIHWFFFSPSLIDEMPPRSHPLSNRSDQSGRRPAAVLTWSWPPTFSLTHTNTQHLLGATTSSPSSPSLHFNLLLRCHPLFSINLESERAFRRMVTAVGCRHHALNTLSLPFLPLLPLITKPQYLYPLYTYPPFSPVLYPSSSPPRIPISCLRSTSLTFLL